MSKILLLSLVFAPDGVSTAVLMTQLVLELKRHGHEISVVTTTPHYNIDPEALNEQKLIRRWCGLIFESEIEGVPVYHASIPKKGNRVGARMLDYLRFHLITTIFGLFLRRHFDVVLTPSPPLTIGISGWLLALFHGVPFIYNVQEIWPELPIRLGVLKNRALIGFFKWLEGFVYSRASAITVISESFRQNLLAKGVASQKLHLIPNFVGTDFVRPQSKINDFSREHGFLEKFVISYAGNIGLTQDFESVLAAAVMLQHIESLQFLVVGDGARRQWLEEEIACLNLKNVLLLSYQPRSIVPSIYASSDLCLVPLKQGTAQDTFPSKVYTVMSAGRPVLACAELDSELAWVVDRAQAGWMIAPENPNALAQAIQDALGHSEKCKEMGRRGRKYVLEHHAPAIVAQQYDDLIRQLTGK